MQIRRADAKDIKEIKRLIKGDFGRDDMERALKRRYGDSYNLAYIIDTCPISLVVISENGVIEGFIGLSYGPPTSLPLASEKDFDGNIKTFSLHENEWDKWLIDTYKGPSTKIHNTLFVNFFCGSGDDAAHMLEALLRTTFEMVPRIQNIAYFLPDGLILFPPFSSTRPLFRQDEKRLGQARLKKSKLSSHFFVECPSYSHCTMPYSLHLCQRNEFYPEFEVRRARVEDCDDLIPILKKNKLLQDNQGDHYMSELLEQKNESFKAIVAEVDGEIVGFMCIDRNTDETKLRDTYSLELFDFLAKVPAPDKSNSPPFVPTAEQLQVQNTFHVTLFCVDPKYASFSENFLHFAFQHWTDLEYCVLTTLETAPASPLLRFFSPVPSLYENNEHLLFVTNRYGIKGTVEVVKADSTLIPSIVNLTKSMDNTDDLVSCVKSTPVENGIPSYSTYAAVFDTQVVGAVVLEYATPIMARSYLDQFNIEHFVDSKWAGLSSNYSIIRYLIINPLFESQTRFICREVMRQSRLNCLLAPLNLKVKDLATKRIAVREFVPVRPRRMIQYPGNLRDGEPLQEEIKGNLQILTIPLIHEPRIAIHTPIVVVGGSDTGLSFLENLIYSNHIYFLNLILISNDGIPKIDDDAPFVNRHCYNSLSLKQLAIDYYVKVIEDTVIQINRNEKTVMLKSKIQKTPRNVRYEYLIMTPGLQYNITDLSPKFENVLGVHGVNKAEYKKIKPHLNMLAANEKLGKIVIYGRSLQAYMITDYCLRIGISSSRIQFFDPSSNQDALFEDKELCNITRKYLLSQKINYFEGHSFDSLEELDGRIFGLTFFDKTHKKVFVGSIGAFLYADEDKVDPYTFKSINDANLVFDDSIVVDNVFRTHDPYVFAAGTGTKYTVALKSKWKHGFCESKEVGNRVAWFLMHLFDPNLPINQEILKMPVDDYSASIKTYAKLPGGLKYFNFDIPKLPGYRHDSKNRDLVIHESEIEFCRIRVDPKGYIYSFTYLGPRDIATQNLACLYGRHEKYFNRLVSRFDEKVIPDFIKFFQETWALVMFHDRFPNFASSLLEESVQRDDIKEIVDDLVNQAKDMSVSVVDEMYDKFDKTLARDEMNQSVFDYLMTTNVFKSYP